jgi:6-phosphogluconolactonase
MGPELTIARDSGQAAAKAAAFFALCAGRCIAEKGLFTVALSGGKTPGKMHRLLAEPPLSEEIPWERCHFFWADERCVPPDHPHSNYGAAHRDLLGRVAIPPSNIHPIETGHDCTEAARRYEARMKSFFEGRGLKPALDLVMLGMGGDGHTASIFADGEVLLRSDWVWAVRGGEPFLERVTLSLEAINRSQTCAFLVTGKEKASAVRRIMKAEEDLPAGRVRPMGRLVWFLDRDAANGIEA